MATATTFQDGDTQPGMSSTTDVLLRRGPYKIQRFSKIHQFQEKSWGSLMTWGPYHQAYELPTDSVDSYGW